MTSYNSEDRNNDDLLNYIQNVKDSKTKELLIKNSLGFQI